MTEAKWEFRQVGEGVIGNAADLHFRINLMKARPADTRKLRIWNTAGTVVTYFQARRQYASIRKWAMNTCPVKISFWSNFFYQSHCRCRGLLLHLITQ
jgi:hypothetical protein